MNTRLRNLYMAVIAVILIAPLFVIGAISFNEKKFLSFPPKGFSFRWYVEIFADDAPMRRKLTTILRRHMQVDGDLDREVRKHLRHLNDGTEAFEIEYQKQLDNFRRKHGLTD